jgi:sugar lactone lactonase YvrE
MQYVVDKELYLIMLTITCLSLALLGLTLNSISLNVYANYVGILKWGFQGTGNGQFHIPVDSAVDSSGNVFVADSGNNRIQVFRVANPCPSGTTAIVPGVCFVIEWGVQGQSDGEFHNPYGVAVDSSGNVFVADSGNNRIQVFRVANPCPSGTTQVSLGVCFVKKWGSAFSHYGTGPGQFQNPYDVAVDSSGNVIVADSSNRRNQMFQLANPCPSGTTQVVLGVCYVIEWGYPGNMQLFNFPTSIAVDSTGSVFVADPPNHSVDMFRFLSPCPPGITQVKPGVCLFKMWGSHGTGLGQFDLPFAIAVDSNNDVFVADTHNNRIQKFQLANPCPSGTTQVPGVTGVCYATEWGSFGFGNTAPIGQFSLPSGVSVDSAGRVYVVDLNNNRIQVFSDDNPPSCTNAQSSESSLWPPKHTMKNITILGVTDPDNDPITITITGIRQDEPTLGLGTGDQSPDGAGVGTNTGNVRVERSGTADGRVYHISFTADDGIGGMCNGDVMVSIPHNQGQTAIDSTPIYDSTVK